MPAWKQNAVDSDPVDFQRDLRKYKIVRKFVYGNENDHGRRFESEPPSDRLPRLVTVATVIKSKTSEIPAYQMTEKNPIFQMTEKSPIYQKITEKNPIYQMTEKTKKIFKTEEKLPKYQKAEKISKFPKTEERQLFFPKI